MKLLVFSDTHGHSANMLQVAAQQKSIDACLFLGDGAADADALAAACPKLWLYRVRGNCDLACFDPGEGLAAFGGVVFFYTHGHAYGVKRGLKTLWQAAHSRGASVALYGHTHMPHYEYRQGIHLFNPGSLAFPRSGGASYGLITINAETPSFEIVPY